MSSHVPMIPCNVAGPLGVLHLPRLWLKVSLEARGKLAAGYPGIGKGFDQMVISGLGLNADAVRKFITEKKPTYSEFEAWVKSQPGAKLDRESSARPGLKCPFRTRDAGHWGTPASEHRTCDRCR